MKKIMILIAVVGSMLMATSCKTVDKATKESQKKIEALRDSIQHSAAIDALNNKDFVFEADRLQFKRGTTAYVQTLTNFISCHEGRGVAQVAPYYGGGPNGVGGVTIEGKVSTVKVNSRSNGTVSATMNIMGSGVSASIEIEVDKYTNRAHATISSNFKSDRITLYGVLLPYSEKNTYKGTSL